jgi:protein SCO1
MKAKYLFGWLLLALCFGCKPEAVPPIVPTTEKPMAKAYDVRGIILELATNGRTATIKHEKILCYMAAMTMDFSARSTNEFANLAPNDEITFKLMVTENDDWIEGVKFVAHHVSEVTNHVFTFHVASEELKPGDLLPDYEFLGEDEKVFRLADFSGRAVAFTFFFTSCPLPEFCPRMNKNFTEARTMLLADTNAPTNWELLSISFDPAVDQPDLLAGYANFYRGQDTNRWLFAVASTNTLAALAPKVDLRFWREGGSISHNLRTVVLDGQRKIFKQFDGNEWTAEDLAAAIRAAAKP